MISARSGRVHPGVRPAWAWMAFSSSHGGRRWEDLDLVGRRGERWEDSMSYWEDVWKTLLFMGKTLEDVGKTLSFMGKTLST